MYDEDKFTVTITEEFVKVKRPDQKEEIVHWNEIEEIKIINTDSKLLARGIWLVLLGPGSQCLIPQNSESFNMLIDIVSKFDGFYLPNLAKVASSRRAEEFLLWQRFPRDDR